MYGDDCYGDMDHFCWRDSGEEDKEGSSIVHSYTDEEMQVANYIFSLIS